MIITIDGPAGSGKSTAARNVARKLGFIHINQGALFRAVGVNAAQRGIATGDEQAVSALASGMKFEFFPNQDAQTAAGFLVDGCDLSIEMLTAEAGELASQVAVHPSVREVLLRAQHALTQVQSAVVEGRDAGSVGFPGAELKVYLDASLEVRAARRFSELMAKGTSRALTLEALTKEIADRDTRDSTRALDPLVRPEGAVVIDTSLLEPEQVEEKILELVRAVPGFKP